MQDYHHCRPAAPPPLRVDGILLLKVSLLPPPDPALMTWSTASDTLLVTRKGYVVTHHAINNYRSS